MKRLRFFSLNVENGIWKKLQKVVATVKVIC